MCFANPRSIVVKTPRAPKDSFVWVARALWTLVPSVKMGGEGYGADPPMSFACAPRSIRLLSFEALFARICLTGVFPLRSL